MKLPQLFDTRRRDPEQAIPLGRIERLHRSFRRRLSDDIEDVFHRACLEKDLASAAGLLAVLEDIYHGGRLGFGYERRINDEPLRQARATLRHCREANANNTTADAAREPTGATTPADCCLAV